jgi:molybdate transport system ATP-binding protein
MNTWLEARVQDSLGPFSLDISLALGREVGVLFGPSGAGKSATLRALAGLRRPQGGFLRLGGRELFDGGKGIFLPPQERRIGLCFQSLALFPHLTALENVAFGITGTKAQRKAHAAEWLAKVQLDGLEGRFPGQLSGGQRQRVALARALAAEPDLLLLDEPFSALDGPLRRDLRRELRRIHEETAVPVLYVTHHVEDLCALGNRIFTMQDGKLTGAFPVERLFQPGAGGEVWHALGWGNLLRGDLEPAPEGGWVLRAAWGSLNLGPRPGVAQGEATVFVPSDGVEVLSGGLPAGEDLAGNVLEEGLVEELVPLAGMVRLEVAAGGRVWQVEHPWPALRDVDVRPGHRVRLGVPPRVIEVLRCGP